MLQLAEPDVPGKATADGSLQFTRGGQGNCRRAVDEAARAKKDGARVRGNYSYVGQ